MVELWLQYAFLAAGIYAAINLVDKVISDAQLPNPAAAMVLNGLPRFLTFVVIGALGGNVFLSSIDGLWARRITVYIAIGTGALYALGMIVWYRGIAGADISRFVPLFALKTIFTTLLAFVFLGEAFPWVVYLGISLIVLGAVIISIEDPTAGLAGLRFQSRSVLALALLAACVFALIYTSLKGLTAQTSVWSLLFWIGVGGTVVTLDFALLKRAEVFGIRPSGQGSLIVNGGLSAVAFFVFTQAVALGPVSLVAAIVNLDAVLVFVGAVALSRLVPAAIEDDISPTSLAQKGVATVLIIGGGVLIEFFK